MRILVLALILLTLPLAVHALPAHAEDAAAPASSLPETAPPPHARPMPLSAGRKTAIAIGALAGVMITNVVTGGLITPVLAAGFMETVPAVPAAAGAAALVQPGVVAAEASYFASVGRVAVTAIGAVLGGEAANWLYRD